MEENKTVNKSIWGTWWTAFRKWFYPAWLIYETVIRFYDYALGVYHYIILQEQIWGVKMAQPVALLASSLTFAICFFFLTVPASMALFRYFNTKDLASNSTEQKIKRFL
ncbi:hypothetical protein IA57_04435 [Mangrovimonas yunxiaonensis]|uniref:Uncharacterized protein n=1 Tax=Mangrovimonas yunxiaonensis TaxID=1197477 RepID=A0A084TK53_9FLAO|nr:hypothetical protein [Mangrovimonas yunxiaonensis]KFB01089.1 hypothetical protein IA57_04435 [Mangrovimonas yunxiaonensis]GGH38748.1 hypothetical protein GCM10011364_07730 [Mangrovimonas yunxiaonensis]